MISIFRKQIGVDNRDPVLVSLYENIFDIIGLGYFEKMCYFCGGMGFDDIVIFLNSEGTIYLLDEPPVYVYREDIRNIVSDQEYRDNLREYNALYNIISRDLAKTMFDNKVSPTREIVSQLIRDRQPTAHKKYERYIKDNTTTEAKKVSYGVLDSLFAIIRIDSGNVLAKTILDEK